MQSRYFLLLVVGIILITLSMMPSITAAQVEFTPHIVSDSFEGPNSSGVGDFDGDGDIDLVATSMFSRLKFWENLGVFPLVFAPPVAIRGVEYTFTIQVHDLDSDGDLDIIGIVGYVGLFRNWPCWWENAGTYFLNHGLETQYNSIDSIIAVGDLDDDGDLDVVSVDVIYLDLTLDIQENLGDGSFEMHALMPLDMYPSDVKVGDLNGDGRADILLSTMFGDRAYYWAENLGDRVIAPLVPLDITYEDSIRARCFDLADMDGDGDLDVLGSADDNPDFEDRNKIIWLENNGSQSPTFTYHDIEQWDENAKTVDIMAVDLNNDEQMDFVAAKDDNFINYWLNDGEMTFTNYSIADTLGGMYDGCLNFGDVDGDGDEDVLVTAYSNCYFAWFENNTISPGMLPFHLLAPEDSAQTADSIALLVWESTLANVVNGGETSYKVYISEDDSAGYDMVAEVTDTTYLFTGDWNTYYFWKIKAESNLGFERWAEEDSWRFLITGPALEPFHLLAPADEAQMDSPEVQLAWRSTSDYLGSEIGYEVYVAEEQPNDYNLLGDTADTTYTFTGEPGIDYFWRVKAVSNLGAERWAEELDWSFSILGNSVPSNMLPEEIPSEFAISSVYPNPFNSSTTVTVALPAPSDLTVTVYDLSGRLVRVLATGSFSPGVHTFTFDASGLPSGMYFVQGTALGTRGALRKILLLK